MRIVCNLQCMNFDELIFFLEKRLTEPLPGIAAQSKMMPTLEDGTSAKIQHATRPREGAVMILLYMENGSIRFPLIQRSLYDGVHSGQMALPGGKKEAEDVSLIQTALRETEEEVGVSARSVKVIGNLSPFFVAASNVRVLPVVAATAGVPSFVPEPAEVQEIITPTLDQLLFSKNKGIKRMNIRNSTSVKAPYYRLEGKTVWGATAMILSEYIALLQEFTQ